MPVTYQILREAAQVRMTGRGKLEMPGMLAAVDAVADDPAFQRHFTVLFDLREADYTAELEDGDRFVKTLSARQEDFQGHFALLVPDALHLLARLFCLMAQVSGVDRLKCFTDEHEARAWCSVTAPPAPSERA